ncbi:hypothetical protein, partial [Bacillus altitudinis]|uniref:hypothetical protein n=1 Tax=Bacillus altitudinis TaxID=293387 RepID=UPI001C92E708
DVKGMLSNVDVKGWLQVVLLVMRDFRNGDRMRWWSKMGCEGNVRNVCWEWWWNELLWDGKKICMVMLSGGVCYEWIMG